ncbi:Protein NRT1/ PTR FAMILY 5.5 [Camellia lanceoleosa]|uniref:Protein NRT1/ PTR FAMILY 5.5 n=1 Tax=Camellia lanceoleosa TaxID=1840588 RepID=A0ACC0GAE8_9ERIC|nr:Protein NRT1/ PTR FAMILY 5.5 [Camellia lanceoleosa]
MATFVRITVLIWADILAGYAMWVMMTYLTNVWKINLTHAAGIINIWGGIASIMPLGFAFLVDMFTGHYAMLLFSSVAYCIGLGFLSMSTPPVLSKSTHACSAYKPECIGHTQKALFYTALSLIAVGISGHTVSLPPFFTAQTTASNDRDTGRKLLWQIVGIFGIILVPIIGGIALPYIKQWSVRFGIPAICSLVATLLFLSGSCSYKYDKPQGSPLTTVFRVFVASVCKMCQPLPSDGNELYEKDGTDAKLMPHTGSLRCLDKAAIILANKTREEQEKTRWRLCRVTEVEETKIGIRIIPMWLTFIACGIISSIGNTFFLEQANHMNRKLGRLNLPLPILLMFYDFSKSQFAKLYFTLTKYLREAGLKHYAPPIGIAASMTFAILTCITAASVETRRLSVIRKHGLLDKPDEKIPMSMFWLLPQFSLLGALDGVAENGIMSFSKVRVRHQ